MSSYGFVLTAFLINNIFLALSSPQLESIYNQISPSTALVQYSSEITNQITGETSRRDGNALGLVVSPDGLIMAPGFVELENVSSFNFRVRLNIQGEEKEFNAVKLRKPDDLNVVFLKINDDESLKFPYVKFTDDPQLRIGSMIAMIGILGETMDYARCITYGSSRHYPAKASFDLLS
jgi:hypothetical protein